MLRSIRVALPPPTYPATRMSDLRVMCREKETTTNAGCLISLFIREQSYTFFKAAQVAGLFVTTIQPNSNAPSADLYVELLVPVSTGL
jgi:hypothetical protein